MPMKHVFVCHISQSQPCRIEGLSATGAKKEALYGIYGFYKLPVIPAVDTAFPQHYNFTECLGN